MFYLLRYVRNIFYSIWNYIYSTTNYTEIECINYKKNDKNEIIVQIIKDTLNNCNSDDLLIEFENFILQWRKNTS